MTKFGIGAKLGLCLFFAACSPRCCRYRTSCGADECDGIAFKENGFRNLPGDVLPGVFGEGRLLSVGIREGEEVSRPFRVGWPEQGQLSGYDAQYDWYAQQPSPSTLQPLQG